MTLSGCLFKAVTWDLIFCAEPSADNTTWIVTDKNQNSTTGTWMDESTFPEWEAQLPNDFKEVSVDCPPPCENGGAQYEIYTFVVR